MDIPYSEYNIKRFDKRTNKYYENLTVILHASKQYKEELYNLFYKPKKVVTTGILDSLDNQGICLWYLDDGNVYYNGNNCHISLAVNGFTLEERYLIIDWFKKKFNLNFKHSQKAIRITSKKECEVFMSIVENFIPECMNYKKLKNRIIRYESTLSEKQMKNRLNTMKYERK